MKFVNVGKDRKMLEELDRIALFIVEVEKLKHILRKTKVIGLDRYENSAEHSWSVSLGALLIEKYLPLHIDTNKIIKMLIVHDIVEIDAGDKFIYAANHCDTESETKAAQRIFGILPKPVSNELNELWLEYETRESEDAKYAYLLDRLLPLILNLNNKGQSWRENKISLLQVVEKNNFIKDLMPELWSYLETRLLAAQKEGWLL